MPPLASALSSLLIWPYVLILADFWIKGLLAADVVCNQPEIPENCHVIYASTGPSLPGATLRYQCNSGFILFGSEKRTCGKNGQWEQEVPVCAMNVGFHRPAIQSGQFANLSVDGDYHTCSQSSKVHRSHGWWEVNLLQPYQIYAVQVVYRKDKNDKLLKDLEIYVGDRPVTESGKRTVCHRSLTTLSTDEAHTFVCADEPIGSHVTLRTSQPSLLNLCEVMVLSRYAASYWQCGSLSEMIAWGTFGTSCYHGSQDPKSWAIASSHCKSRKANLLNHVTLDEHHYLRSELQARDGGNSPGYWIGLVSDANGRWVWSIDGYPVADTIWADPSKALPTALKVGKSYAAMMARKYEWSWSPSEQETWNYWICKANILYCGSPAVPENGGVILSSQTYSPGAEAYYYCRNGYMVLGQETRKCLKNGTWSDKRPICKPVICGGLAAVENGLVTLLNKSSTLGSVVQYECKHGHKLSGSFYRICQSNGLWSDRSPQCLAIDCGYPEEISHGTLKLMSPGKTTTMDSIAEYSCHNRYKLIGERRRVCLEDSLWVPNVPVCVDINSLRAAISGIDGKKPINVDSPLAQSAISILSGRDESTTGGDKKKGLSPQATNLVASFIAVVVVMVIAISIVVFWVWRRRKQPPNFLGSNSLSGRSSSNAGNLSGLAGREILYAFTSSAALAKQNQRESIYQLTSEVSSDQTAYDPTTHISFVGDSNIYASPSVTASSTPNSEAPLMRPHPSTSDIAGGASLLSVHQKTPSLYYSTIKPENTNPQKLILLLTDETMLKRLQNLEPCATLPRSLSRARTVREVREAQNGVVPIHHGDNSEQRRLPYLTIRGNKHGRGDGVQKNMERSLKAIFGTMARKIAPSSDDGESSVVTDQNRSVSYQGFNTPRPSVCQDTKSERPKIPPPPIPDYFRSMQPQNIQNDEEPERCETPDSQLFAFESSSEEEGELPSFPNDPEHITDAQTSYSKSNVIVPKSPDGEESAYDMPPPGVRARDKALGENIYEEVPKGSKIFRGLPLQLPPKPFKPIETSYTAC